MVRTTISILSAKTDGCVGFGCGEIAEGLA